MRIPYVPLGAFYFFYFAVIGGFMPYWGLYLQSLGFDAAAIGQLSAIVMATRIFAPNFWGYIADRSGRRLQLVRLGALMITVGWLGVFAAREFWPLATVLLIYGFFQNAILAQFEAVTMAHLGARRERYSQVRLWGSLGFIVTGTGLGAAFDHYPVSLLPLALLICALGVWLSSLAVPDIETRRRHESEHGFLDILARREVWTFFLAHFLLLLSHAPYYTFYSIHLENHGYSRTQIGWLWGLGVFAEVMMFLGMHRLLPRAGERRLLLASLLLSVLAWLLIGWLPDWPGAIWGAQLLHAASFASFHAAAMVVIFRHFGDGHQGQGQAVYSMLWGVGVALGSWLAGEVWSVAAAPWVFSAAALLCLLAWLVLRTGWTAAMRRAAA
ncbi:MAG: MFS transporter [Perlucidibaca sp.]